MALDRARSGEVIDLSPLGPDIANARSTALIKADRFETIRLIVPSKSRIPPHQVSGEITLHCLEGRVRIGLENDSIELAADQWVYFDGGVVHSVEGIEDACVLLTIMLPARA